jgi:hypothetical protein
MYAPRPPRNNSIGTRRILGSKCSASTANLKIMGKVAEDAKFDRAKPQIGGY